MRVTSVEVADIPAIPSFAVADRGDTYMLTVIATELVNAIHVKPFTQRKQGFRRPFVFFLQIGLAKPLLKAFIAHIVRLAFAYHRFDRAVEKFIFQQHGRQKREVFILHRVLKGDAGGGKDDRAELQPACGTTAVVHRSGCEAG